MLNPTLELSPQSALSKLVVGNLDPAALPIGMWSQVIPLALAQGLGPMLLWAVRDRIEFSEDEPPWQALVNAARQAALKYTMLEHARQLVSDCLSGTGIPAIWLKGIALAKTAYPAPVLRPMLDLDVLVPYDQRKKARQALENIGFRQPVTDYLTFMGAPEVVLHHDQLSGGPGRKVLLELHFRLLGLEGHTLLPQRNLAWFWEQTQSLELPQNGFTILKPEAHLLYLCAHAILQHSETELNLLRLLDLHLLIKANSINWPLIVEYAQRLGWSYAVRRVLGLMVEQFATPVETLSQLRDSSPADERLAVVAEKRSQAIRWEAWKMLLRETPFVQRPRLIWTTLFPPASYLRQVYAVQAAKSMLPYYFYRWWDAGREITHALRFQWARHFRRGNKNVAE